MDAHLPLVMKLWGKYGIEKAEVLFPIRKISGIVAVCVCSFRDEDAISVSFSSQEAIQVWQTCRTLHILSQHKALQSF